MPIKHEVCWSTAWVDKAVVVRSPPMYFGSITGAFTPELFSL